MQDCLNVTLLWLVIGLVGALLLITEDRLLRKQLAMRHLVSGRFLLFGFIYYDRKSQTVSRQIFWLNFLFWPFALASLVFVIIYWFNPASILFNNLAIYLSLGMLLAPLIGSIAIIVIRNLHK